MGEQYPGKHSVVMVDNVSFHHNEMFEYMIEQKGAILLYLPSYMPKWNITEYYFNGIKSKERMKQVFGNPVAAMVSLCECVEEMKDLDWFPTMKEIGFVRD